MVQRSWWVALVLAVVPPGFDRLYLGYLGLGILKFFTFGGCLVWWAIDIVLIATGRMKDAKGLDLAK